MGTVTQWWSGVQAHTANWSFVQFLKDTWLVVLLLVLGAFAAVTAVIVAYPALAHLAARYFQ